ncbi:hypothetical protein JXA12_04555 [Candidatus Woesearchaeota archaeon]|nr:hypothetical protein [Candidatus Woesearchaeota archaeon]
MDDPDNSTINHNTIDTLALSIRQQVTDPEQAFFSEEGDRYVNGELARLSDGRAITKYNVAGEAHLFADAIAHVLEAHRTPLIRKEEVKRAGRRYLEDMLERHGATITIANYESTMNQAQQSISFRKRIAQHNILTPKLERFLDDHPLKLKKGVHPNERGYTMDAERAQAYVRERLAEPVKNTTRNHYAQSRTSRQEPSPATTPTDDKPTYTIGQVEMRYGQLLNQLGFDNLYALLPELSENNHQDLLALFPQYHLTKEHVDEVIRRLREDEAYREQVKKDLTGEE